MVLRDGVDAASARRTVPVAGLNLLIVEDEPALREMVAANFRIAGYRVSEAGCVASARRSIALRLPDLVLLDWMLPDASGLEFLRVLRRSEHTADLPVILLTARAEESDRVRGLDVGADDYVSKPFSLRELEARVRAVLRRAPDAKNADNIEAGGLSVSLERHEISVRGTPVHLGPTEFRLLHFLMRHPERVFSRSQLLDRVWGHDVYIEERTVDVHIRRLRKNLGEHDIATCVQTVRGIGYRFSVT